jgi:NAD(P)-dependent dehydrogenase (short-subunit alcohol dehydrogenase family)
VPVFEGQKLVVVGGNRGIGRVTAADAYRREIPCQCERS